MSSTFEHCLVLREYFSQILIFENCTEEEMQKKQIHHISRLLMIYHLQILLVRTKVLTSLKELASLMSLKWIEPSILGFKQITLAKTNANDLK